MNCEPHPKCSSKHRPKVGEVWLSKGQLGEREFRVAHCTPWTVEGPRLNGDRSRVIVARRALIKKTH